MAAGETRRAKALLEEAALADPEGTIGKIAREEMREAP
jgi:hypothetical protein